MINEDLLGLDSVYIQAKRWENPVGRPEVQRFAGALQGHRSLKGVLLTTSSFTTGAEEYVSTIDSKIVLINGLTLTQLMVDHNVGVSSVASYEIKKNRLRLLFRIIKGISLSLRRLRAIVYKVPGVEILRA